VDVTVIFVEPETWGNVGSIARCMKNFGFSRLVLVSNDRPGDEARTLAMHAADILESALIVPTLEEALRLVETSIATTCIDGSDKNFRKVTLSPRQLSSVVRGKVGIVIGREGSGLTNAEISACDVVVRIPTSPGYPAMNASHACCVLLYELSRVAPQRKYRDATRLEKDLILEDVSEIIKRIDTREFKRRVGSDVFGAVLERSFMTGREAYTLKGIFRKVRRKLEKKE
jgi:TrmH family RNA methyltransferase